MTALSPMQLVPPRKGDDGIATNTAGAAEGSDESIVTAPADELGYDTAAITELRQRASI